MYETEWPLVVWFSELGKSLILTHPLVQFALNQITLTRKDVFKESIILVMDFTISFPYGENSILRGH